jgi:hypothetical protein
MRRVGLDRKPSGAVPSIRIELWFVHQDERWLNDESVGA